MQLFSTAGKEIMRASAELAGSGATGKAEFTEYEFGTQRLVKVVVDVQAPSGTLMPGLHAVHIHETGIANEQDKFKSAGGHFDPGPAGNSDPDVNHPYHSGDLPNIVIDESGKGHLEAMTTRVTLSEGPLSIFDEDGASLMIHGHADPYKGGEHGSGVSGGPRLVCGVIKRI